MLDVASLRSGSVGKVKYQADQTRAGLAWTPEISGNICGAAQVDTAQVTEHIISQLRVTQQARGSPLLLSLYMFHVIVISRLTTQLAQDHTLQCNAMQFQ